MYFRILLSGVALTALTACGGGGGGGGTVDLNSGDGSFGDLVAETDRLTDLVTGSGATYVSVDPDVGSATDANFDGIVLISTPGSADPGDIAWVGQIDVDVNFETNVLDGTASNFFQNTIASDGSPGGPAFSRDGTVSIGADVDDSDFVVVLGGEVDLDGTGLETVEGNLEGNFFGPNSSTIDAFAAQGQADVGSDTLDWSMVAD